VSLSIDEALTAAGGQLRQGTVGLNNRIPLAQADIGDRIAPVQSRR
jgi:hypothetical protein